MDQSIERRVRAVISQELGQPDDAVATAARLQEDLGADSMDSYSLVSALEMEFGIEIPDYDLGTLQTVGQLVAYVQEKVGTGGAVGYGHGV